MLVKDNLFVLLFELIVGADGAPGFGVEILPASGLTARDIPAQFRVGLAAIPWLLGTHVHSK